MKRVRGQMSESFVLGALLAIVGGFLDVYTYLCRGSVFANAQTGNIVLLGLDLSQGKWAHALRYLLPIAAFAFGVIAVELIRGHYQGRQDRDINIHWRQVVVLAELILLAVTAFAPQAYNMAVNTAVSFVCAMQVESFRKVQGSAFATTMCTGNLRSGTEQLVIWRRNGDVNARRRGLVYYSIILFFILGAVVGGMLTGWFAEKAVLAACALLAVVFCVMFVKEEENIRE